MLKCETEQGTIIIEDEVIRNIVAEAVNTSFGVAGMEAKNTTEEIFGLFKKDAYDKGIFVKTENNEIYIDLHIMVSYGINIPAITDSIVHKVSYSVEEATGFSVKKVNVYVDKINTK